MRSQSKCVCVYLLTLLVLHWLWSQLDCHIRVWESVCLSKGNDPINNKVNPSGGQTNRFNKEQRRWEAGPLPFRWGAKKKKKLLFSFPWRRHPRAQREPAPLCALPSQELVIINKATCEIIFWANILIKTVPSVTCMLYFHLVLISPTLSSKNRQTGDQNPDGAKQKEKGGTDRWCFSNWMTLGLHDQPKCFYLSPSFLVQ